MTPTTNNDKQPILVGYDGSEGADRALRAALQLLDDAPLLLATVVGRGLPLLGGNEREAAQQVLERGLRLAREHTEVLDGTICTAVSAPRGLLKAAHDADARAVVVGFRGHSTTRSMLMGSCSYGAVHHAERPTLIVPDRYPATPDPQDSDAALVAADAHDPTPEPFARALHLITPAPVIVIHVAEGRLTAARLSDDKGRQLSYDEIRQQIAKLNETARDEATTLAKQIAEWLARETGRSVTGEGAMSPGAPWQGIVERSDQSDIDLVIVGSRGLGALDRTTLGSCSNAVIHHARKPILVVP